MKKSRITYHSFGKTNRILLFIVGILTITMLVLGGSIVYRILSKQAFEHKIETLQREKDNLFSEGNEKDHFKKGQAEIITYYPLVGDNVLSSVQELIQRDISDKVEDKEMLIFYYSEKEDSALADIENQTITKQVYDLSSRKVNELEKTTLAQIHLRKDGSLFTLDQLFTNASKAKEELLGTIKTTLQDKQIDQSTIDQVLKDFSGADLSSWKFSYKDSQLVVYPSQFVDSADEIDMPVSSFFDVIESSYLTGKDADLYKSLQAQKDKKVVALTFDDGPNPATTPQALDTLAKYNVKATFFVLGKNIAGNESLLKRMKSEGHEIGNHSWDHPVLTKLPLEDAKKEITDTEASLVNAVGTSSKLMRPPYGAISDDIRNSLDLSFILWNVDSLDWKSKNETAILTEIQHQVTNGSIVLMHDIHQPTVNSLPKVIEYLKEQGYTFVTVSELLNVRLKTHGVYYDRDQ